MKDWRGSKPCYKWIEYLSFLFVPRKRRSCSIEDEQFRQMVQKGVQHCQRGDVFQLVLSREFQQAFSGDDFNVYRSIRSVNPSPYLFYFDYGNFRIFGSSPESQIQLKDGKAYIDPIAGTVRRSGDSRKIKSWLKK